MALQSHNGYCLIKYTFGSIYSKSRKWPSSECRKEKRLEIEGTQKACTKDKGKEKPNKDKIHFNGTAMNHTESALKRNTQRKSGKEEHEEQKQACKKNIFVNTAGFLSIILLVYNLSTIHIKQKQEKMHRRVKQGQWAALHQKKRP